MIHRFLEANSLNSDLSRGKTGSEPGPSDADAPPARDVAFFRNKYLGPMMVLIHFFRVATTFIWLGALLPIQIDLSFPEGALVARAHDAMHGRPVYQDWREWPHAFAPYGPLTYYPVGWVARALGSETHPMRIYTIGRVQSLLAIIGICAILGWITRRAGMKRWWPLVAIAFFITWDHPLNFMLTYRPDAPEVMFSLGALAAMMGGGPTVRRSLAVFAALSLSMWFKPTAWGMVFTAVWWIGRERGWLKGIAAGAAFGAANLLMAAALNHATRGALFLNMIDSLDNGLEWENWLGFYTDRVVVPKIFLLGGLFYAARRLMKSGASAPMAPLWVGVILTFILASLLGLKAGADVNYYVEPYAIACVVATSLGHSLWTGEAAIRPFWREGILLGFFLPLLVYENGRTLSSVRKDLITAREVWGEPLCAPLVREIPGEILIGNPFLALIRPSIPTVMDQVQYNILVGRGRIDGGILLRKIQNQDFDAIIYAADNVSQNKPNWIDSRAMTEIERRYIITETKGNLTFMRPRQEPDRIPGEVAPPGP